ncbi:MAG: NAD(P)/FAD-dependent oxidoreductase [Pseudorhodobacter sp.]
MDTDFIIIGGGIAGVSAAAHLAPFGSVTLLEAEAALAHHASGRSAALYEPRYGSPPVVALSLASDAYFRQAEGVLSERGLMLLAREEEAEEFAHDLQSMDFTEITPDEAIAMVPVLNRDVIARAGFAAHAWDIDTDLLVQGFARTARAAGARIVTGAQVSALSRDGAGWRIASSAGDFSARMVVNAAGAWVDEIAKLAGIRPLGFQPYRRSMARIPAPGGHDVSRWPMIFGAGETWYAKPDAGALIVSPAEEHPMPPHDAWADDMVLAEGLARYEEFVTEPVTRLLANWAGLRTFAPDRSLVIGPDAREPSFFWLAGQGGQGFQSCPAASQLAADLIAGRAPEVGADVVAAVAPGRFG